MAPGSDSGGYASLVTSVRFHRWAGATGPDAPGRHGRSTRGEPDGRGGAGRLHRTRGGGQPADGGAGRRGGGRPRGRADRGGPGRTGHDGQRAGTRHARRRDGRGGDVRGPRRLLGEDRRHRRRLARRVHRDSRVRPGRGGRGTERRRDRRRPGVPAPPLQALAPLPAPPRHPCGQSQRGARRLQVADQRPVHPARRGQRASAGEVVERAAHDVAGVEPQRALRVVVGPDAARGDRGDRDAGAVQRRRDGVAERQHPGLRRAVGVAARRQVPGEARDVEHAAAAAGGHRRDRGAGEAHQGRHVEVDLAGQRRDRRLGEDRVGLDARVVDQQLDRQVPVGDPALDGGQPGRVGEVGGQDLDDGAGGAADPLGDAGEAGGVARHENDGPSALGELVGVGGAEPAARSGDQCSRHVDDARDDPRADGGDRRRPRRPRRGPPGRRRRPGPAGALPHRRRVADRGAARPDPRAGAALPRAAGAVRAADRRRGRLARRRQSAHRAEVLGHVDVAPQVVQPGQRTVRQGGVEHLVQAGPGVLGAGRGQQRRTGHRAVAEQLTHEVQHLDPGDRYPIGVGGTVVLTHGTLLLPPGRPGECTGRTVGGPNSTLTRGEGCPARLDEEHTPLPVATPSGLTCAPIRTNRRWSIKPRRPLWQASSRCTRTGAGSSGSG
ncbi:hypothetical protein L7F22_000068 [Adiantum nelumboides]|nr:hypothetical protein [Adiantum nelumboides]